MTSSYDISPVSLPRLHLGPEGSSDDVSGTPEGTQRLPEGRVSMVLASRPRPDLPLHLPEKMPVTKGHSPSSSPPLF